MKKKKTSKNYMHSKCTMGTSVKSWFSIHKEIMDKICVWIKKKRIYNPQRNGYMYSSSRHHRKGKLWPWCHSSPHFDGDWQTTYLTIMLLIGRSESIYKFYLKVDIANFSQLLRILYFLEKCTPSNTYNW